MYNIYTRDNKMNLVIMNIVRRLLKQVHIDQLNFR